MLRVRMTQVVSQFHHPVVLILTYNITEEQLPIAPAAQQVVDVDVPEIGKHPVLAFVLILITFVSVPASSDHVDNDIDIDIVDEPPLPTSPAHTPRDDITTDLSVPVSPA